MTNNGIGVAGVGFKCKIMAVKVSIDDDSDNLIYYGYEGIVYAVDNGAKVINCSWGGGGGSRFEQEIINYATSPGSMAPSLFPSESSITKSSNLTAGELTVKAL